MGSAAASRRRPGSGSGSGSGEPTGLSASRRRPSSRRVAPPLEHRILMTATLCLLAFGAVMVYSASSPVGALSPGGGSGAGPFIRYVAIGSVGLAVMYLLERRGLTLLDARVARLLLIGSFVLLLAVMVPGIGVVLGGSRRWF